MTDNITQVVWKRIYERCVVDMQQETTPGTLKYTNFSQWLAAAYPPQSEAHHNLVLRMQQLDTKVASALDIPPHHAATSGLLTRVPPTPIPRKNPSESLPRHTIALWNFGFLPGCAIKGPSPTCDVVKVLTRSITEGNKTHKYPIEVLFSFPSVVPAGHQVEPHSIGIHQGFATVLGQYVWIALFLEMGFTHSLSQDEFKEMCPKLMAALRMSCTYEPEADFQEQVYSAIATKKVAGQRQPPNLCQLRTAFGHVVKRRLQPGQNELALMLEEVKNYNRQRRVSGDKASNDEIAGLKVLCVCWETTIQFLEGIWGSDRVDNTSLPLAVVAMKALDRSAELPVQKSSNPCWYEILTPNAAKYDCFFRRIAGRTQELQIHLWEDPCRYWWLSDVAGTTWGCWRLLGTAGGCWGLLEACWRLLRTAGGCWELLGGCWRLITLWTPMSQHSGQPQVSMQDLAQVILPRRLRRTRRSSV